MKKYLLLFSIILSASIANSQGVTNAVRYAQENLNGTARYSAMSGAFGALGGDLSAININPAGSVIFSNNKIAGTLSSFNKKNNSDYFGTKTDQSSSDIAISQLGGVFVFEDSSGTKNWNKLSFGMNYENTNNFDNEIFSKGTNPKNSVAKYFLSYANPNSNQTVIPLDLVQNGFYDDLNFADQQAFLGYQGYVINPNSVPNVTEYLPNNAGGNYKQENSFVSTGYNGKLTFNGAASYKNKILIGVNFNSHFSDYKQVTRFSESNNNSTTTGLRNLSFKNELYTYGSGFSMNIGAITKINKEIRAGLAWESPTWLTLNDELLQDLKTTGYNYGNPIVPGLSEANPDTKVTIIYPAYKLQTPSKTTASLAYVFGKKGLINIDYAIRDYSNTKYKGNDFGTVEVNNAMSNLLTSTNEVRVGAEYRIKQVSLRAGLRNEQSPFKDKKIMTDLKGFSGGLGYNFGNTVLDVSFSNSQRTSQLGFFQQGFIDGANIKTVNNNVTLTMLFEL